MRSTRDQQDRSAIAWVEAEGRPLIAKCSGNPARFTQLADAARVVAWLAWGTRLADIARSAVLLATRYRNWGPTGERVRVTFVDAYNANADRPPTTAERKELDARKCRPSVGRGRPGASP